MATWAPPSKVGDRDPAIAVAKDKLRKFSYGKGVGTGQAYTEEFGLGLRQFQNNVHSLVATRRRNGPDIAPADFGALNWATKVQLGVITVAPPAPTAPPRLFTSFTGTWGAWNNGFGFDVGERIDRNRYQHQGLGYNTNAFLMGNDPGHSYIDMLNDAEAEYNRLFRDDRRPKVLSGYSGGANAVVQVLNHWPADRRGEILGVIQFGDPSRPPGKTLLGNDPGGHGISEDFPPDWVLNRYYSFTIDGDMYPNAVGLLPIFYDILARLEATPEFAMWFFTLLVSQVGNLTPIGSQLLGIGSNPTGVAGFGQLSSLLPLLTGSAGLGGLLGGGLFGGLLGGLGGLGSGPLTSNQPVAGTQPINLVSMLLNIPAIIQSLLAALRFLTTQAHSHYGDQPVFGGLTAVDRAVQIVNGF